MPWQIGPVANLRSILLGGASFRSHDSVVLILVTVMSQEGVSQVPNLVLRPFCALTHYLHSDPVGTNEHRAQVCTHPCQSQSVPARPHGAALQTTAARLGRESVALCIFLCFLSYRILTSNRYFTG